MSTRTLVGIDVGGTFTDFVVLSDDGVRVHKVPSTPSDQSRAVSAGIGDLGVGPEAAVVHGTTVATNALLERRGARTALLTTAGFRDVLVIGRQNRPHLYRLSQTRPPPLVPDHLRFEVTERLDADGAVVAPLDERAVTALAERLADDVESLAVVFLFSFLNPEHEQVAAALIRAVRPDLPISLSSEILPEYREYERTATTVANAYVRPPVERYLGRLGNVLEGRHVRVLQSNGGAIGLETVREQAARLVLSGPAGGVVGAFSVARQTMGDATPRVITLDMGGTSTDVSLCPGEILRTAESTIAGLPLRLPAVDVHTVGAGGGSIARVDVGGALRVGPESAGADPGPVCYGLGGAESTVTDANLVAGRLDAARFLGGDVELDAEAAHDALVELGVALGLTPEAAALGVLRVANASMERALRRVSVERGYDPRDFTLVPFGGAGPLHACDLADALGIQRILVPPHPGVLSALGLLLADVVHEVSQAVLRPLAVLRDDPSPLQTLAAELRAQVGADIRADGIEAPTVDASLDVRYRGQSYELTVPLVLPPTTDDIDTAARTFHADHEQRYGYAMPDEPIEVVALRVRAHAPGARPRLPRAPLGPDDASDARVGSKPVWFTADSPIETVCYARDRLAPGHRFSGPALVFQFDTTILVTPDWQARVDEWKNVWITRRN